MNTKFPATSILLIWSYAWLPSRLEARDQAPRTAIAAQLWKLFPVADVPSLRNNDQIITRRLVEDNRTRFEFESKVSLQNTNVCSQL
jgi:hypothetical protein